MIHYILNSLKKNILFNSGAIIGIYKRKLSPKCLKSKGNKDVVGRTVTPKSGHNLGDAILGPNSSRKAYWVISSATRSDHIRSPCQPIRTDAGLTG